MKIDLHTHSRYSDGVLTPADLVARAVQRGVTVLALTDHDETGGLAEAARYAEITGLALVPGVEISATWENACIHVVGLHIDPGHSELATGLATLRARRHDRAVRIAARLEALGIGGSLQGASSRASNGGLIGRVHFARFLVAGGYAHDLAGAFRRYLAAGRPAFVPQEGADLGEAISWIRASGGQPVLAHPWRYFPDDARLSELLEAFREAGGAALEVSAAATHDTERCARHARRFGLGVSCGSDFHAPGESRRDIGACGKIPSGCRPVWAI